MYSFEELERKCKKYHFKRKIVPLLLVLGAVAGGGWYLWHLKEHKIEKRSAPLASSSSLATEKKRCYGVQLIYVHEKYKPKLLQKKKEAQELGLECHINYGKLLPNNQRQLFLVCETKRSKKELKPILTILQKQNMDYIVVRDSCKNVTKSRTFTQKKATSSHKTISNPQRSLSLADNLIETESLNLKKLQNLYASRKSYDLAMRIAKAYYEQKDLKNALVWAKRANRLDRQKEEAWILYAKTLYELGRREKAKLVLRIFLDYKDSKKAKKLLKKWR